MEASAAIAVILRAARAVLARRVCVRVAAVVVRAAMRAAVLAARATRASAAGTAVLVAARVIVAAAIAAALTKEFLLVEDAAALADLLVLRLPHPGVPRHPHASALLCLLGLLCGWGRAKAQHGRARRHDLIAGVQPLLILRTDGERVHGMCGKVRHRDGWSGGKGEGGEASFSRS